MNIKPKGYWDNYANTKNEIKKYKTLKEFRTTSGSVYNAVKRNKWYHLIKHLKPKESSKKEIHIIARKCKYKKEFQEKHPIEYRISKKNGWYGEITSHMIRPTVHNKKWTLNSTRIEALKYENISDFRTKSNNAYSVAKINGWLKFISTHLINDDKPRWSKELAKLEGTKYDNKTDFSIKSRGAYKAALREGWLDEVCKHMVIKGHYFSKLIYVYKFADNHAYVGLTQDMKRRDYEHLNNVTDSVYKHIKKTNSKYELVILTGYLIAEESQKMEEHYKLKYKNSGWHILNIAKTGSLGSNIVKWTEEAVYEKAIKYNSKIDFMNGDSKAYKAAYRHGYMERVCSHMTKSNNRWDKESLRSDTKTYNSRNEFRKNSNSAYQITCRKGWLDEFFQRNN